jgi:hypothetical protein
MIDLFRKTAPVSGGSRGTGLVIVGACLRARRRGPNGKQALLGSTDMCGARVAALSSDGRIRNVSKTWASGR